MRKLILVSIMLMVACGDNNNGPVVPADEEAKAQCESLVHEWLLILQECAPDQVDLGRVTALAKCEVNETRYSPLVFEGCERAIRNQTCAADVDPEDSTAVAINLVAKTCLEIMMAW